MTDYIIDDDSVESKLLQQEYKGNVIKVGKYDKLDNWLVDIIEEDDEIAKVYLPFCYDNITTGLRAEINMALYNYPKLRIVLPYEQMDKRTIDSKATNLQIEKLMEENREKAKVIDYGKYRVGGDIEVPIGKEVANDTISPEATGGHENISDPFINKLKEVKEVDPFTKKYNEYLDKRRRKKVSKDENT